MSVAFEVKTAALGPRIITSIGRAPFFVTEPSLFYEHPLERVTGIEPAFSAWEVTRSNSAPSSTARNPCDCWNLLILDDHRLRSVAPSFAHGSRTKSRSLEQAVSRR